MRMDRRKFVRNLGLSTVVLGSGSLATASACVLSGGSPANEMTEDDDQILFIGDDIAIAQTKYGKVQGYMLNKVYTFLGIPYGADTSGKNRFMPPQEPKPWTDIRPAVFYGNTAPQNMNNRWPNTFSTFTDHWNYGDVSEDCLYLNVWTPALADEKKRPVLVWLHGGGFTSGNGIEQDGYHGENLSRAGDIVFCSVNHRLGPIGFSDLSAVGGEKYKDSGNVGMLDIVAALRWVHENIAHFGGDPENVTIIGQSGGGSKVCTIASMPAAKGLVHKAVALSGSTVSAQDQKDTRKIGEYILKEAGLTASQIDKLQEIPWMEYIELANRASEKYWKDQGERGRRSFSPVADGRNIPTGEFFSPENSADTPSVPMIFCTTFHEWNPNRDNASLENMTREQVVEKIKGMYGDKAESIVNAYAKCFPDKRPVELWAMILSSRTRVVKAANAKLHQAPPVYVAWFGWCPPLFNGRMRAFHCLDICFWFKNTDRMFTHTGGGKVPRALSDKMSAALLNFMRTGNPNGGSLPAWPQYTEEKGEVMILNNTCEVKNDPDREARAAFGEL